MSVIQINLAQPMTAERKPSPLLKAGRFLFGMISLFGGIFLAVLAQAILTSILF